MRDAFKAFCTVFVKAAASHQAAAFVFVRTVPVNADANMPYAWGDLAEEDNSIAVWIRNQETKFNVGIQSGEHMHCYCYFIAIK